MNELLERLRLQIAAAKRYAYANGGWSVSVDIDDLEQLIRLADTLAPDTPLERSKPA